MGRMSEDLDQSSMMGIIIKRIMLMLGRMKMIRISGQSLKNYKGNQSNLFLLL